MTSNLHKRETLNEKLFNSNAGFRIDDENIAQIVMDESLADLKNRENTKDELRANIKVSEETASYGKKFTYEIGNFVKAVCNTATDEEKGDIMFLTDIKVTAQNLALKFDIGQIMLERIMEDSKKMGCGAVCCVAVPILLKDRTWYESDEWYKKSNFHPYYFYKKMGFEPDASAHEFNNEEELAQRIKNRQRVTMVKFLE